jgi:hypothetical protein
MTNDHDHSHDHDHHHAHDHPHHHAHPETDPNHVEFIGGRPILNVANVPASLRHYTEVLGFEVSWAWSPTNQFAHSDEPPTIAQVMRGHATF